MIPAMLVLNIIPEFRLDVVPLDTIPLSRQIIAEPVRRKPNFAWTHRNLKNSFKKIYLRDDVTLLRQKLATVFGNRPDIKFFKKFNERKV